jgi:RNA polymerase sigma factor (sigma-70 family)
MKYEKLVWSVCSRSLNQVADAEDAFQTTFLIMVEKADRIRKPESVGSWLYGVARKTAFKIRKKRARLVAVDASHFDDIIDESTSFDSIARQQLIDRVDQHIQSMPKAHRTPLVLKYFGGFTAQEIADQMNLSVAAVEGRLRRAKAGLRNHMPDLEMRYDHEKIAPGIAVAFASCQFRIESVAERCVAMFSGSSRVSQIVNMGTKIMIAKCMCAAGVSALMFGATVLHIDKSNSTASYEPAIELNVGGVQLAPSPQLQLVDNDTESTAEEPEELLHLHAKHIHRLHDGIAQHALQFFKWLHQ